MTLTPEPRDKLDATTQVAVNGPADDLLHNELIVRPHLIGPFAACSSRMRGDVQVRFLGEPDVERRPASPTCAAVTPRPHA